MTAKAVITELALNHFFTKIKDLSCPLDSNYHIIFTNFSYIRQSFTVHRTVMQTYTLYELNEYLRRVLALNMRDAVWISCEISTIKPSGGHYYMELVEKDGDEIVAQSNAVLWKNQHKKLVGKLGFELPGLLREGIQILAKVRVHFHEKFGLKLHIEDLDAAYTLGQMELKRREIITRLKREGLLRRNAEIPLSRVLQRVAVISSAQAAGWKDFEEHIAYNPSDYRVDIQLFTARMQGKFLESDVLKQLAKIEKRNRSFDVVVIIRGGGSRLDLSWFDSYELGRRIAKFPLPVLTGIGHETDETVTDLVAHSALKTPTAVAQKILNTFLEFDDHLNIIQNNIYNNIFNKIQTETHRLDTLTRQLEYKAKNNIQQAAQMLEFIQTHLSRLAAMRLNEAEKHLAHLEHTCHILSPEFALQRGFSITLKDGKPIDDVKRLKKGDEIETRLNNGSVKSKVS